MRNSVREEQSENPQHRDQSKRVHWHKSINWDNDFSVSSKEHRLRSIQIIHIKQLGIKFQNLESNSKYWNYIFQAIAANKIISQQ